MTKLVVNTNVLMTFFWKSSVFRKVVHGQELELLSPEFALEEINKHENEIKKKADINNEEFKKMTSSPP